MTLQTCHKDRLLFSVLSLVTTSSPDMNSPFESNQQSYWACNAVLLKTIDTSFGSTKKLIERCHLYFGTVPCLSLYKHINHSECLPT